MTEYPIIAFAAFLILAYGVFSKISEKSVVSASMVFISVGQNWLRANSIDYNPHRLAQHFSTWHHRHTFSKLYAKAAE